MKSLTYFELDLLKYCQNIYGVSPCTATMVGSDATGTKKCYQSPNTCQDPPNFNPAILTIRFAIATDYLPLDIECIPSIQSISTTPQMLDPGESLGQRESVSIAFGDHPYNDVGLDKYYAERGFNPLDQGTFWSKFVARYPYIQGSPCRVIRGEEGQTLAEMETRHYIVETTAGPGASNSFTITAKDFLKLLDGKKAQIPRASNGVLLAGITAVAGSLTLYPAGIGDIEYPASGIASMGDEQVTFTRVADAVTLTARGVDFSTASAHELGETFQLGVFYDGEDPSDIMYDMITGYTEADPAWMVLDDWLAETQTYIGRLYTRKILKPMDVSKACNELINEVGLVVYSDVINELIILKALRQFIPLTDTTDSVIIEGTLSVDEQPEKRVSLALTFFGQKNPLESTSDEKNYRVVVVTPGGGDVAALEERLPSIRKIHSSWINVFNRPAASALNEIIIRRYENAPRKFKYELSVAETPVLASAVRIYGRTIVDDEGLPSYVIAQIISLNKKEARYSVVAEEMTFVQEAVTDRLITIDVSNYGLFPYGDLRAVHDSIYAEPESGDNIIVIIESDVIVGSGANPLGAFVVGDWPSGVTITITVNGRFQGAGGGGGINPNNGQPGKVAFYTRYPVTIDNTNGEIWGGGGGGASGGLGLSGAGSGGGGGAGSAPGAGGTGSGTNTEAGNPGTTELGGDGGADPMLPSSPSRAGGDGGDPGQNGGVNGIGVPGGFPGAAIDGDSFVTFIDEGSILGPRVN